MAAELTLLSTPVGSRNGGVDGRFDHRHPGHHLLPFQTVLEVFPQTAFRLPSARSVQVNAPDPEDGTCVASGSSLIPAPSIFASPIDRNLPCSTAPFHSIPLPLRRRVLRAALPDSSPLPWPSRFVRRSALLLIPCGVKCRRCRIHFMLRTTVLRLLLRGLLRFSTSGYPEAPGDSYVALWRSPRPDFRRLANGDFQGVSDGRQAMTFCGVPAAIKSTISSYALTLFMTETEYSFGS